MVGPQVTFLVGPDKKRFCLPKKLACYCSPYFKAAFDGAFKEGETQELELPEDSIENFQTLQEFIVEGKVSDSLSLKKARKHVVQRCIGFLAYADKYMLGDVEDLLFDPLKKALVARSQEVFCGKFIKDVFEGTKKGSQLRVLITEAALSNGGISRKPYKQQEDEVDGFAAEMLQLIRKHLTWKMWSDPLRARAPGDSGNRTD